MVLAKHNISFKWVDGSDIIGADSISARPSKKKNLKPVKVIYPSLLLYHLERELSKPKSMRMISIIQAEYIKIFASNLCGKWVICHDWRGVVLNTVLMEKFFGSRNLRAILKWLKHIGFISVGRGYKSNGWNGYEGESRHYKLLPNLIDGNTTSEHIRRPLLLKKLHKWFARKEKILEGLDENYQYAISQLGKIKLLPVNEDEVLAIANKLRKKKRKKNGKKTRESTPKERANLINKLVDDIKDNGFRYYKKDKIGRLHHSYIALPKELRQKVITQDGKPLNKEIDFSNLQMCGLLIAGLEIINSTPALNTYISKTIEKKDKSTNGEKVKKLSNLFISKTQQITTNNKQSSNSKPFYKCPTMFSNFLASRDKPKKEWLKNALWDMKYYAKLCLSGQIYEFFQRKLGKISSDPAQNDKNRKAVKKWVLASLFAHSEKPFVKPILKIFREYFPSIYEIITALKQPAFNEDIEYAHSKCARVMQLIESSIMFEYVIPQLREHHPDIIFITCHDALFTTEDNGEIIKGIMKNALLNEYNIELPVK